MASRLIPMTQIYVEPDRQRRDLGDITGIANSIDKIGQIQPVVLEERPEGFCLIAGERRFRAMQLLRRTEIEGILKSELSDEQRILIELEENIKRKQLVWTEEVAAVARYVDLEKKPIELCAEDLGIHPTSVSKMVVVAKALSTNKKLLEAPNWTAAYSQIRNDNAKLESDIMESVFADEIGSEGTEDDIDPFADFPMVAARPDTGPGIIVGPVGPSGPYVAAPTGFASPGALLPTPARKAPDAPFRAECQSFLDWAPSYSGKRFNLIHCDFPYGLNMDKANLQNSASRWDTAEDGRYADSPELFDSLVSVFFKNQANFVADSAHCIFWTAHKNYGRIASRFAYFGWNVCEVPLIWHKTDNAGIAPDVYRWPRRTYEIAVFASFGDRKISKIKAASYGGPTTKEHHLSEKPLAMLEHFLEMTCDSYTEILDPTCGSGTALTVAKRLGARSGLGLDTVSAYVEGVNKRLTASGGS